MEDFGNKSLFEDYMSSEQNEKRGGGALRKASVDSYSRTLTVLSLKCREQHLLLPGESIWLIDDITRLNKIWKLLCDYSTEIGKMNYRGHHIFSAAISNYIKMLKNYSVNDEIEEIVRPLLAVKDNASDIVPRLDEKGQAALYAKMNSVSYEKNPRNQSSVLRRERSSDVKTITVDRANDKCDLCGGTTFLLPSGHMFLECHHLVYLSNAGADAIYNTVALCPNCHRKMHLGLKKEVDESFDELLQKVNSYLKYESVIFQDPKLPILFKEYFHKDHPAVVSMF